jgi:hypothetical protein
MRYYLALALIALVAFATVVVACSDSGKSCKTGTLGLTVELDGTAAFADTLTLTSANPPLTMTVPHSPNDTGPINVDVTFPGGYPTNTVVRVLVRASGGVTLLGENVATVHLLPDCSNAFVAIVGGITVDAFPTD